MFLDVDGTLLELAVTPDRVVVPEGLVGILQRLQYRGGEPIRFSRSLLAAASNGQVAEITAEPLKPLFT